mmetsp:Transcript_31817/g.58273  ORF Transcript_31817/g.58273 Transcript_31817/m.58273 type:complete len:92 (+) Transcript_31817:3-278(+)
MMMMMVGVMHGSGDAKVWRSSMQLGKNSSYCGGVIAEELAMRDKAHCELSAETLQKFSPEASTKSNAGVATFWDFGVFGSNAPTPVLCAFG